MEHIEGCKHLFAEGAFHMPNMGLKVLVDRLPSERVGDVHAEMQPFGAQVNVGL